MRFDGTEATVARMPAGYTPYQRDLKDRVARWLGLPNWACLDVIYWQWAAVRDWAQRNGGPSVWGVYVGERGEGK